MTYSNSDYWHRKREEDNYYADLEATKAREEEERQEAERLRKSRARTTAANPPGRMPTMNSMGATARSGNELGSMLVFTIAATSLTHLLTARGPFEFLHGGTSALLCVAAFFGGLVYANLQPRKTEIISGLIVLFAVACIAIKALVFLYQNL